MENVIPDYEGKNYQEYNKIVMEDFRRIKNEFPLLKICYIPTVKQKELCITGRLIPKNTLDNCKTEKDIQRWSINIRVIYPSNISKQDIVVEDVDKKINWTRIPQEHKHENVYNNNIRVLCTHHPNGEINMFSEEKRSIKILYSAWSIYIQYRQYLKTGKWTLRDLKHGDEGKKQLIKENKYYER